MMQNHVMVRGRQFASNGEQRGVFELRGGAYLQHRGTGQTPLFRSPNQLARYVCRMLAP